MSAPVAIATAMQELRAGPRADWAPPVAAEIGLAEMPAVLLIGTLGPEVQHALVHAGYALERARTLSAARAYLCVQRYRLIVADAAVDGGAVVDWSVALRAGHRLASGVPQAVAEVPVLLVPRDQSDDAVALGSTTAWEVPMSRVARIAVALASEGGLSR